jgi:hypothetical protein
MSLSGAILVWLGVCMAVQTWLDCVLPPALLSAAFAALCNTITNQRLLNDDCTKSSERDAQQGTCRDTYPYCTAIRTRAYSLCNLGHVCSAAHRMQATVEANRAESRPQSAEGMSLN